MSNEKQHLKDLKSDKNLASPVKIFGYSTDAVKAFNLAVEDIIL